MKDSIKQLVEAILSGENPDSIFSSIWNQKIFEAIKLKKQQISKTMFSPKKYREDAEWKEQEGSPVKEAADVDGEWRLVREIRNGKIIMVKRRISRKITESENIEEGIGRGDRADALGGKFRSAYTRGKEWDENTPKTYKKPEAEKLYHSVKFDQKDTAKAEGMRWDADKKMWYHTDKEKSKSSKFPRHEAKQ